MVYPIFQEARRYCVGTERTGDLEDAEMILRKQADYLEEARLKNTSGEI